jgi:integrase
LLISALRLLGSFEEKKVGQKWDKAYRRPVLRDRGGDLSKQWYVEFYYESGGKFKRKKISKLADQPSPNRLNNYYRRRSEMLIIRDVYDLMLSRGWTPDNAKEFAKKRQALQQNQENYAVPKVGQALTDTLAEKKPEVALKTWKRYKTTLNTFLSKAPAAVLDMPVNECRRKHIMQFFRNLDAKNTTRNSFLTDLRTLFARLELNEVIESNPCRGIPKLKATVEGNVAYTHAQVKALVNYTHTNYPDLLDFIRLVGYAFLRPSEILAIQIKHIDLEQAHILLPAKKAKRRTKEIVTIISQLKPTLERRISGFPPDYFLFGHGGRPGPKGYALATQVERVFVKARNELQREYPDLNFTEAHKLYSIRHTFIQDLYQNFRASKGRAEAEYALMPITRHKSLTALTKYILDNALEKAPDWGAGYRLSLLE